ENDHLIAMVRPAQGGHLYELDIRNSATNVLATLDRRPEPYHEAIREAAARLATGAEPASVTDPHSNGPDPIRLKQQGLDRLLVYDRHPRKALVDHFYPVDVTLDDLAGCRDLECGDFAGGTYLARIQRDARRVAVVMERPGRAGGHTIRIRKTIEM